MTTDNLRDLISLDPREGFSNPPDAPDAWKDGDLPEHGDEGSCFDEGEWERMNYEPVWKREE